MAQLIKQFSESSILRVINSSVRPKILIMSLEVVLQQCVDYVQPILFTVCKKQNIMKQALESQTFPAEFLQFKWDPLLNSNVLDSNMDALINIVLKRVVTDALVADADIDNDQSKADEAEQDSKGSRNIEETLNLCAAVLDFCFHSRHNRKVVETWGISFFGLFSTIVDILPWPTPIYKFWEYPESRIEWFKMGNSLDILPHGITNLTSYKQPLFDKLRHWNDMLNIVQKNYYLNTPRHYEIKFKMEKFISELLPLHEESNFNRSALISNKQSTGNIWNKTISSATRIDDSSENVFATDYNYIFDNLLTCPLEFLYKPLEFKIDMDKVLTPLLDAIFEIEEDFYKEIKLSHRKLAVINQKLNTGFPLNFETLPCKAPRYMRISDKINNDRMRYCKDFIDLFDSTSLMVQPTLLDISIANPASLYQQMLKLENDFYRKQFLMQLYFSVGLIRNVLTSKEVESYYKSCYQKEKPSRSINFGNLTDANFKKTHSLCNHIIDNRIAKFYYSRDSKFLSILQSLLSSEQDFMKSKIDGFKQFQIFKHPSSMAERTPTDYAFKKFGFIKMGNKAINNIWKINTGLNLIDRKPLTAEAHYAILKEKWKSRSDNDTNSIHDNVIVKQWQNLRSIRSKYLFSFKDVNESVGISGLFDSGLIEKQLEDKRTVLNAFEQKLNSPHQQKLHEARLYMKEKKDKKQIYMNSSEDTSHKKRKLSSGLEDEELQHEEKSAKTETFPNSELENVDKDNINHNDDSSVPKSKEQTKQELRKDPIHDFSNLTRDDTVAEGSIKPLEDTHLERIATKGSEDENQTNSQTLSFKEDNLEYTPSNTENMPTDE